MEAKLSGIETAIVVSHTMRRFMLNFEPHERTRVMDRVITRLKKFLIHREKVNFKEFFSATELEKRLYLNAVNSYDKNTSILALEFVTSLYEYFKPQLKKYVHLNEKDMLNIGMIMTKTSLDSKKSYEFEKNSGDLLNTYIMKLEPFTGVGVKKSPFAGKKLTIKNNMIIDGKKIASGF